MWVVRRSLNAFLIDGLGSAASTPNDSPAPLGRVVAPAAPPKAFLIGQCLLVTGAGCSRCERDTGTITDFCSDWPELCLDLTEALESAVEDHIEYVSCDEAYIVVIHQDKDNEIWRWYLRSGQLYAASWDWWMYGCTQNYGSIDDVDRNYRWLEPTPSSIAACLSVDSADTGD